MRRSLRLRVASRFFSTVALVTTLASAAVAQAPKQPIPFPNGFDFPANAQTLQLLIGRRMTSVLRMHSWYLWAGVNQPGRDGWPIWRSWNIATQAFAPNTGVGAVAEAAEPTKGASLFTINVRNNPPINLQTPFYEIPPQIATKYRAFLLANKITTSAAFPDGDNFQNNGDTMLVAEPYNQWAFDWIRSTRIYEQAELDRLLAAKKTDVPQFPAPSIVMKHMYWPVAKDRMTALPIVDMANYERSANPYTTYVGFENQARWPKGVAIDPRRAIIPPGETASVTYLHYVRKFAPNQTGLVPPPLGPNTYPRADVVPLSQFYVKRLSMAEFKAMSIKDQLLIDSVFCWVTGRLFEDGDYLVAIASHVITKEAPGWTLQTFWWEEHPEQTRFAADRPIIPRASGPWQHYLLNTEDGVTAQPGGATLPIVYNPYIELASHPVATNCRNCHIRAATPGGQYIQNPGPGALVDLKPNDPIFAGKLRSDFLWTIVDRAVAAQTKH